MTTLARALSAIAVLTGLASTPAAAQERGARHQPQHVTVRPDEQPCSKRRCGRTTPLASGCRGSAICCNRTLRV